MKAGGARRVTMQDVARLASVSTKTVSNVLNGHPKATEETKARVLEAVDLLGYRINVAARNLRQGKTGQISLALPELKNPYFAELADLVLEEAKSYGFKVLVQQTNFDRDAEVAILEGAQALGVDGVIFSPLMLGQADLRLFNVDFPLVLLGEAVFDVGLDHVTMSNVEAARAATEHLLDAGRSRIALVGADPGDVRGASGLRLRGYKEALAARGIPVDETLIVGEDRWHRDKGSDAVETLLARGARIDAVLALNDLLAFGAIHALKRNGLSVPQDVAVIGFDDTEAAQYTVPSLSSINPGRDEIATLCVKLLAERIEAATTDPGLPPRFIAAPFRVMARDTTAALEPVGQA